MMYDTKIFQKHRALAITDVKDLVVGNTYYSNGCNLKSFTIKELLTNQQCYALDNSNYQDPNANEIGWILTEDGNTFSLHDKNVGASYNPWLIFDTEQKMMDCIKELVIDWSSDPDYEYDDYEYDDYRY
jgi:hypothetical protein